MVGAPHGPDGLLGRHPRVSLHAISDESAGTEAHEFLLATTAENLKHEAAMRKNPDMEHDEPNGLRLAARKSGEILWKFTKRGTFEYACLIPDHREYGMTGKVIVK